MTKFPVDRLVRVWAVETQRAGTGFRFAADRVLTAAHVVRGATKVEILDREASGWLPSPTLEILWPAGDVDTVLDAVVLSTEPKDGVGPWPFLASQPWATADPWESRGFPSPSRDSRIREPLSGPGMEYVEGDDYFTLRVGDTRARSVKTWKGISGAPVFRVIKSQMVLSGLITEGPEAFLGSVLRAVPLPALLRDDSFRAALLGDEPPWHDDYVQLFQDHLGTEPRALNAVRVALGAHNTELDLRSVARQACCDASFESLSLLLAKSAEALEIQGEQPSSDRLRDVLRVVAPPGFLRQNGIQPADPSLGRLDLPVASEIAAEACMAAIERRPMLLEVVPGDVPAASRRVQEPPRFGIDADSSERVSDIAKDLEALTRFGSGPAQASKGYLLYLAERLELLPPSLRQKAAKKEATADAWKIYIADVVNRRLAARDETLYLLLDLVDDSADREQFLLQLGEDLSALKVATFNSDHDENYARDDAQLGVPFGIAFATAPSNKEKDS